MLENVYKFHPLRGQNQQGSGWVCLEFVILTILFKRLAKERRLESLTFTGPLELKKFAFGGVPYLILRNPWNAWDFFRYLTNNLLNLVSGPRISSRSCREVCFKDSWSERIFYELHLVLKCYQIRKDSCEFTQTEIQRFHFIWWLQCIKFQIFYWTNQDRGCE